MRTGVVFTLTGTDRVGIVEDVTRIMLGLGANVETSRMVRLGGEFAIIMLVSVPAGQVDAFDTAFETLAEEGYAISVHPTVPFAPAPEAALSYHIDVEGADHEGIVHEIARGLSARGINIEAMETRTAAAPETGAPLFSMSALVTVPADIDESDWMAALAEAGEQAGVDVEVALAEAR